MKDIKNNFVLNRCPWADGSEMYKKYHDEEWGVPLHDDIKHFEMLILEGAQAGLSWSTILSRRAAYRKAFKNFEVEKVAGMTDSELEKQLQNPEIIRNRLKIYAARKNAIAFLQIQKEFGSFNKYIWKFVGNQPIDGKRKNNDDIPASTKQSEALSKDLKKRGMSFVGPTIIYAHMQATGLVNDHVIDCWRYNSIIDK
jgi:DNA-3-methyladenine glycosylase I